jgi:hypothetical protein
VPNAVFTQDENRIINNVIDALGQAGRPIGRPALNAVASSGWTQAVISRANDALKKIGN